MAYIKIVVMSVLFEVDCVVFCLKILSTWVQLVLNYVNKQCVVGFKIELENNFPVCGVKGEREKDLGNTVVLWAPRSRLS